MPGSLKIKILSARNLPIMDRASDLTDAFVEVRMGNEYFKTEVCKKSLNPFWNTEWITFELDDQQLQEENIQIRVLDHDTYSSHDSIGKVYINLDTLLIRKKNRIMIGWFPIYDTMHGIRGELNLSLRLDLFSDISKYRQSSIGVRFFYSKCVPEGYVMIKLLGFVEKLILMDDPEHEWREKLRTSRSSNETRQRLFSKLIGELQKKIGIKVLEMQGNSVIGFQVHFDLEGETGVVIRGIGTVAELGHTDIPESTSPPKSPPTLFEPTKSVGLFEMKSLEDQNVSVNNTQINQSISPIIKQKKFDFGDFPYLTLTIPPIGFIESFGSVVSVKSVKLLEKNHSEEQEARDAWWLELRSEISAHMRSMKCNAVFGYTETSIIYEDVCILTGTGTAVTLNSKYQLFTPTSCSTPNSNDINLNKASIYSNNSSRKVSSNVPPVVPGTESINNNNIIKPESNGVKNDSKTLHLNFDVVNKFNITSVNENAALRGCRLCHIPIGLDTNMLKVTLSVCQMCGQSNVPEIIFSTSEIPEELPVVGQTCLIQARVFRSKRETKGEACAKEINELLPFLEYDMHYKLVHNLIMKGLNGLFGLKIRLCAGDDIIVAIGTGTGVFLSALCLPSIPKPTHFTKADETILSDMLKFQINSRSFLGLTNTTKKIKNMNDSFIGSGKLNIIPNTQIKKPISNINRYGSANEHTTSGSHQYKLFSRSISDNGKRTGMACDKTFLDTCLIDLNFISSVIREGLLPKSVIMETINFTKSLINPESSRMIVRFIRTCPLIGGDEISSQTLTNGVNINEKLDSIMQQFHSSLWLKLRRFMPCVISNVNYLLHMSEDNHLEIIFTGFVSTSIDDKSASDMENCENSPPYANDIHDSFTLISADYNQLESTSTKTAAVANITDTTASITDVAGVAPSDGNGIVVTNSPTSTIPNTSVTNSLNFPYLNNKQQACFLFTPLSSITGFLIDAYLGSINFFFVRETTSLREYKGIGGFVQCCINEAQAVVSAHTMAAGGNAVLTATINDTVLNCSTNTRQMSSAQVLVNIYGDMVHGTYITA